MYVMSRISVRTYQRRALEEQHIVKKGYSVDAVYYRAAKTIFAEEARFGTSPADRAALISRFMAYARGGLTTLGMPMLRAAGNTDRSSHPLASCTMPAVSLHAPDIRTQLRLFTRAAIGFGFDITEYEEDPAALIAWINDFSRSESEALQTGRQASMVTMSVDHPRIRDFVAAKNQPGAQLPFLNLSVIMPDTFMERVEAGEPEANELFDYIADNARVCGDPGVIFIDRLNHDNPLSATHPYITTPPCGEKGMIPGETCHFAYINLAAFVQEEKVDYTALHELAVFLVRMLDDAVEYSVQRLPDRSAETTQLKRPIAIGVCGLADMLIKLRLPYASSAAREVAGAALSTITYASTRAAVDLVKEGRRPPSESTRSSVAARQNIATIVARKLSQPYTPHLPPGAVDNLLKDIQQYGIRNFPTTALPPSGLVAILFCTEAQLEPLFNIYDETGRVRPLIRELIRAIMPDERSADQALAEARTYGSFQAITVVPQTIREVLKTATEVDPLDHLRMVKVAVDTLYDSVSKTINLPAATSTATVRATMLEAYRLGLKSLSVYVDGSRPQQPKKLARPVHIRRQGHSPSLYMPGGRERVTAS